MYNIVNSKAPKYLSDLFSNARETNLYKCKLRNTEYDIDLNHTPKTDYGKEAFSYRSRRNVVELSDCRVTIRHPILKLSLLNITLNTGKKLLTILD